MCSAQLEQVSSSLPSGFSHTDFFWVPSLSKENSEEELEFSLWRLAEGMVKEKPERGEGHFLPDLYIEHGQMFVERK